MLTLIRYYLQMEHTSLPRSTGVEQQSLLCFLGINIVLDPLIHGQSPLSEYVPGVNGTSVSSCFDVRLITLLAL
jgi:hypothetical protein